MDRTERLEKDRIGKLLFTFSLPVIIGMLVLASYNIVDRIFVGRGVGSLAISGIAITFPVIIIFLGFSMLIGVGATSLISIRLGEKNIKEAEQILANALTLTVIISLSLTTIFYLFLDPILILFGASGEVLIYAHDYSVIILAGGLFQSISYTMNNMIRGEGNPKMAMATMLIGAILNTILNPIFIFGFKMGIQGSAYATVIAQFVSAAWVLLYFFGKKSHVHFHFPNLKLKKEIVIKIMSIGVSPFIMQIAQSIILFLFNKMLAQYGGDLAIAAMGISNSIAMFILMPIFGLNQGIQPIIGYNFGAKLYGRVIKVFKLAMLSATLFCTFGFLAIMFFSEYIIHFFSKGDIQLIDIGANGLRILMILLPLVGFQVVNSGYFLAMGKSKQALILTISRQIVFLIPALFILPGFFGLNGVWMASPVSDGLSAVLSFILMFRELKSLNKLKSEQNYSSQVLTNS